MHGPLSRHLVRFSEPVAAPEPDEPRIALGEAEARIAAARAEAGAEAAASFGAELRRLRDERAAEAARHEAALAAAAETAVAAARADWAAGTAADLAAGLDAVAAALRDVAGARLAVVLQPLLEQAVVTRALAALVAALDQLLADPAHPLVTVKGPADLLGALRAVRGEAAVAYEVGAAVEVTMTADGAHVETRLAAALATLQSATAAPAAANAEGP